MGGSPLFAGGLQMETEKRAEEQKRTEALELLKSILGNTQCQRKGQGTGDSCLSGRIFKKKRYGNKGSAD